MLQPREPRLLWRKRKRRHNLESLCCSKLYCIIVLIGSLTHGLTQQHNDDVYIVKPTPALHLGKEELTTVLLVNTENHGRYINVRPEIGLLTSTARTFIQEGVTTEYATQVVGTTLDNGRVYAQYLKKSSRILYDSGSPVPSVVTSWVGESLHSDAVFLPQSHNDLFNADQPDWQAIDDRLVSDHRHKDNFVGSTDFVGLRHKPYPQLSSNEDEEAKTLSGNSLSMRYVTNSKPAYNFVPQLGLLEENARKVAANKVLPIGDLSTYTIKQNYEPSVFKINTEESDVRRNSSSSEPFGRNPKLIYKKIMESGLRNEHDTCYSLSCRPTVSAIKHFATVTYYGFAEFTTVVGDSVIVFSPSTATNNLNYAHVTSIKGEATLAVGSQQGPSVSEMPIKVSQDIIEPTVMQQPIVKSSSETLIELSSPVEENTASLVSTEVEETKSSENTQIEKLLETSAASMHPLQSDTLSTQSTTMEPSVMLSRPSDEEVLRIFNALANAEADKTNIQSTSMVEKNTPLKTSDEVIQETSNVQIFGGATTIFFEDDPFANFVVPSKTILEVDPTTSLNEKYDSTSDEPTPSSLPEVSKIESSTAAAESVEDTTEQSEIIKTTTDQPLTTSENNSDLDSTTISESVTKQSSPSANELSDTLSNVLIKEIDPASDGEILHDCISTSQVFLTQLPKTVTLLETVTLTDASQPSELKTEVRQKIQPTFEIKEATKHYCIQASTINVDQLESKLVSPIITTTEKEDLDAATETNNETDKIETIPGNAAETTMKIETERYDLNENKNSSTEEYTSTNEDPTDDDEDEEDEAEEASGHAEEGVDDDEEIELIYKTLYTTYTYLTTFFHDDSTSISSHTEVLTNVMTSTLGIKESSSLTNFSANSYNNEINPTETLDSIQLKSTKRFVVPSEVENFIRTGEEVLHEIKEASTILSSSIIPSKTSESLATFYTTYTYYTTIFAEGETELMSHTEVVTNIKKPTSSSTTETNKIMPTASLQAENLSSTIISYSENAISYNPANETAFGSVAPLNPNDMSNLPTIPDLGDLSAITLVTDVRSSSSPGKKQIINNFEAKIVNDKAPQQQSEFEDQISSESNTDADAIMHSATLLLQTSFTTFTYYTTMYSGDKTNIVSHLETMTNTVTETLQLSTTIDLDTASLPITYFTTFTYWTKLAREGQITTLSREKTISNVIIPTVAQQSQIESLLSELENTTAVPVTNESTLQLPKAETETVLEQTSTAEILPTTAKENYETGVLEPTTYYTTYTYYTTSYEADKTITNSRFQTVTNIITPTVTSKNSTEQSENLATLTSSTITASLAPEQTKANMQQSAFDLVLYDFKKIIDADGISTIFFTTEIKPTLNSKGLSTQVISSSSSLLINEEKRSLQPTSIAESSTHALGPDAQTQKQYKTGLVRLIEGTRIANRTTTLYQSKVIGTIIDQRYAQIIESTSSFIFEKTKSPAEDINPTRLISPTSSIAVDNGALTEEPTTPLNNFSNVEGSMNSSSEEDLESTTKSDVASDEENSSKNSEKQRFPFQTKKAPFIPPLKTFSNRNRPQFAPKKNSSATIITRSDFTPTITATPALKTINRFSSTRRGSASGISSSNSALFATSSRRFGRPSKSISGSGSLVSSSLGISGYSGSSRNRFASSSNTRNSYASSSRRLGGPTATIRSSLPRPSLFSSGFPGNSRLRVRPTSTVDVAEATSSIDTYMSSQEEGVSQAQDELGDEEENTTEINRRQNNPLLRLRRPLNRPRGFTPSRSQSNSPNNAVSVRKNPLPGRARSANTASATTTTTAKPKPRTFQPPIISQNRVRPTNSLFPPRNIFGVHKPAVTTEENKDVSEEETNENNDDFEYEDDDDEESDGDDDEENSRRRRSNNKAQQIVEQKTRSKREADSLQQNRSNFRNRFRRPKLASPTKAESRNYDDDEVESKETATTPMPPPSTAKKRSRFAARYSGHASSSTSSTVASPSVATSSHKTIRPTRPTNNNSGRAQFTLREKDFSAASTTTQKIVTSAKRPAFRRPQPGGSVTSRRLPSSSTAPSSSTSGKRRLKAFSNNDSTTTSRNSVTGRSRPSSTTSTRARTSGTSRDSTTGGRNRNRNNHNYSSNNNEGLVLDNSGTIIVTHVIPAEVTIPVVNGKVTEYKQVVTAKTSTEVLGPQQYTTSIAANGLPQLALTREDSSVNYNGATEVTKYLLHETPTTTITFTPTTIRGRKTSFSHVLASTVYSVEQVVSTVQPQISANAPLANILLSQLLLGNVGLPAANPLLGALGGAFTQPGVGSVVGPPQPATPVTEYKTHASTYVTTVFEGQSTVLPVTFQASQEIPKQFQHFDSGQDASNSDTFFQHDLASFKTTYAYSNIEENNDNSNNKNEQVQNEDIDEARYNLATRIMSNGVEVIIASDKSKTPDRIVAADISNSQLQYNKPMTLAASTIENQMMILLFPSSRTATDNSGIVKQSVQQVNYNLAFHTNHFVTKTCLTTYTYRTTYVENGRTIVESREKVITNIATEERNYPKIIPTQTVGVTLTKTPELAVGIFPTTYSYFNTFRDNSNSFQVVTSEYTVINTITGPNDYVAYLQPTAEATPALKTNTYYNEITLSQKIKSSMHTVKRNLTQVVITKSYAPPHSTSVITSYYTYDDDSLEDFSGTLHLATSSLNSIKQEKETDKLNDDKMKIINDLHIYATKTFLTTLTYYTTTVLSSYATDSKQTKLDIKPVSTAFNYYTRVIENVITDSVPATLLPQELLTKMKMELKKQKTNQHRRLIVTTATLKDGQTIKISAMEMYNGNLSPTSLTLSTSTTAPSSQTTLESFNISQEEFNQEFDVANDDIQPEESSNKQSSSLEKFKGPENHAAEEYSNGIDSLASEQIPTVVEVPSNQTSNDNNPLVVNDNPSATAANQLIQRLTALKPMFNAMADLLQNNFGVTRDTIKPTKNIESKQVSNKKISSSAPNSTVATKHPIYIPVQKSAAKKTLKENYTGLIPQSLHIKPPLLITDENNYELKESQIKVPFASLIVPRKEQPLHNGGIYIRPGELITANSDIIIGKPNGIDYVQIPNHMHLDKNSSESFPLDNRQFQVTYYYNKVQHPYKKKSNSVLTPIIHKPHHIPLANNKLIAQATFGSRYQNEQNFNKNILKPPPPPPISKHTQLQGPSLMLTAPDKPPEKARTKTQTTTNAYLSAEATSPLHIQSLPLTGPLKHKLPDLLPSPLVTPSRGVLNFYNLSNELKSNEILQIKQISQVLAANLKPNLIQNTNLPKPLSNINGRPPQPYNFSSSQINTNLEQSAVNRQNALSTYMRWQPEANIVQTEKESLSSEYVPKFVASSNWQNNRQSQIKATTSSLLSNLEKSKKNPSALDKNPKPELAIKGSSVAWNIPSDHQTSQEAYQYKPPSSSNLPKRPSLPTVVSTTSSIKDIFFKDFPSAAQVKYPFKLLSSPILDIDTINSSIDSATKNRQNISLDQHIFSHTVDVNVPPLTFNREDHDYPQQEATAVRGQILAADNAYKYMPLITIPSNKQQVQVSLTPLNSMGALSLPLQHQNAPSWNKESSNNNNDNSNNYILHKISPPNANFKISLLNDQDQKTFESTNILNVKAKTEASSNWKHQRRQQPPSYSRLNNKSKFLATTKPISTNAKETGQKISTTEHLTEINQKVQQTKDSRITNQTLLPDPMDMKYPSLRLTQPHTLRNEFITAVVHDAKEKNNSDSLVAQYHNTEEKHKQHISTTRKQPPTREQQIQANQEVFKGQNRLTRVSMQKPEQFTNSLAAKTNTSKTTTSQINEGNPKDIKSVIDATARNASVMQPSQLVTHGEPFRKTNHNDEKIFSTKNNRNKTAAIFVAPGKAFGTSSNNPKGNMKIATPDQYPLNKVPSNKRSSLITDISVTRESHNPEYPLQTLLPQATTKLDRPQLSSLKINTPTTEKVLDRSPPPLAVTANLAATHSLSNSNDKNNSTMHKIHPDISNQIKTNNSQNISSALIIDANSIAAHKTPTNENSTQQPHPNFKNQNLKKTLKNHTNHSEHGTSNGSFKFSILAPSESYEDKTSTAITSPLSDPILTYTTTTIKRIILPTKYITNKRVYTVTTTASALPVLLISSNYLHSTSFLFTTETTTDVTTLYLTHTQINTIIDTVTSVKTLEPITITATTTVKPSSTNTVSTSVKPNLPASSNQNLTFSSTEPQMSETNQNLTYLPYPSVEVVSTNITQDPDINPNENSIFIIMTNKKNTVYNQYSAPQFDKTPKDAAVDNNNGAIDGMNEVMIEYDNGISFDDIHIRDEELGQIINGKSVESSAFVNNVASIKKSTADDHVILGGVLIATPPKLAAEHFNINETLNTGCYPNCKASRNELCGLVDNRWSCFCRPGFARMFPDRPCKPTYTYDLLIHAERVGNYHLQYVDELQNNKTEHYKYLSQLVNNALDRMIMQSDFRDAYHGVEVTEFADGNNNHHGLLINVLLQLSDNSNEKRLEKVLKKSLRLSNYSIGGTDLYTNKLGADILAIKDFNECLSRKLHDCSENAHCFNLPGTYTCSCEEGYVDLSDNPIYPGRICSSEQVGCKLCHYHGKCAISISNSNNRNYCECFPWYAGSKCQVNLKILLIVLLGIGTLLFILLLFCILITCTKRRNNVKHTALAPSTVTSSSEGLQKPSRLADNMIITNVGLRSSLQGINLKRNKRQKVIKIDKRSMIKDSSSETSQNSLPYTLKNRDSVASTSNKKKSCLLKHNKIYKNYASPVNTCTMEEYPLSIPANSQIENQSDLNTFITTSSSFKGNNQQTEQRNLLKVSNDYEGHYCEQSDRSLTVMIPRAKYHSSVLSQTQLMHHQLTMERIHKTAKSENKLVNVDKECKRNLKSNSFTTRETADEETSAEIPSNPGALISAGFEVSAIVRDNAAFVNSADPQHNDLVRFDSIPPNYTVISASDAATSLDLNSGQKHGLGEERQHYPSKSNKTFSASEADFNAYNCGKDSAEARSFDETTIRASTKPLRVSVDGPQTKLLHDEVNTMAERDLGSTFFLPHTHLYKPERYESELSGFDSF